MGCKNWPQNFVEFYYRFGVIGYWNGASLTPPSGRFPQMVLIWSIPVDRGYRPLQNVKFFPINSFQNSRKLASNLSKTCDFSDLAFFRASMLPCKLQSGETCMENFWWIIRGPKKEITGCRYWGSGAPWILYRGAEICTNCVFCRKWCLLWSWVCVTEQIFLVHTWDSTAAYQSWILLPRSQFRSASRIAWNMTKKLTSLNAKSSEVPPGPYKGKNFHSQIGPLKWNVHQK